MQDRREREDAGLRPGRGRYETLYIFVGNEEERGGIYRGLFIGLIAECAKVGAFRWRENYFSRISLRVIIIGSVYKEE